ncbi:hypothetical protein KC329_g40 [Hortaea werneckii]|nr:hypothetical protein KC329_g40 [Hortaea werneckii]
MDQQNSKIQHVKKGRFCSLRRGWLMWRAVPHQPEVRRREPEAVSMYFRWATEGSFGFVRKAFFWLLDWRKM